MKDQFLIRDKNSGAVLNTDRDGLDLYKKRKNKEMEVKNRIEALETRITDMSSDLDFIKKLLLEKLK